MDLIALGAVVATGVATTMWFNRLRARAWKEAAEDLAAAISERGRAKAEVIRFNNEAEAAGWRKLVEAFGNDGNAFARWVMFKKIAPAYRQMMVNLSHHGEIPTHPSFQSRIHYIDQFIKDNNPVQSKAYEKNCISFKKPCSRF